MDKKFLYIYSDYLIAQNHYATATGLSDLLDGQISHDKITRFLNSKETTSKDLWEYIKPEIRKIEQPTGGVLILDDTIQEKTYTDENEIICWHYSHAKNRCIKGINLLSCLVRYGDIALPIACDSVYKDIRFCDVKTKKEKRRASISKNEMFRAIIAQAVKNEVQFDYVLADNWFGAKKNIFASIVAYCKLEFLKMKTSMNHFALKYKLLIKANQMAFQELQKLFEKQASA